MFFKLALIATTAFAVLAAASPMPSNNNQCQTGSQHCCQSVQKAGSSEAQSLIGLVGAVVGLDADVGLTCSPLDVANIGGNSCTEQPVCCTGNNFSGLVVVGCTPINL